MNAMTRNLRRRGMTIVELSVTTTLAVVVGGLLFGALLETGKNVDATVQSQQARQEALLISRNIEKIVRMRSANSDKDSMGPDALTLGTSSDGKHTTATMATVRLIPATEETGPSVEIAAAGASSHHAGVNRDRFCSTVAFRYGVPAEGDKLINYSPRGSAKTKVIEYTIQVWPRKKGATEFAKAEGGKTAGFVLVSGCVLP